MLETLCPPALIYVIFSLIQIMIDSSKGLYNTAFIKFWVTIIFTILLNYLCNTGLGIVSWIIVFIPFILMSVVITLLLLTFGLNPTTGKLNLPNKNTIVNNKPIDYRKQAMEHNTSSYYDNYNDNNVNNIINQTTKKINKSINNVTDYINNDVNEAKNDLSSGLNDAKNDINSGFNDIKNMF